MKSVANGKTGQSIYPCLMISNEDCIVLFESFATGTVVSNSPDYVLGSYSDNWDMDAFNPFIGSVLLES